jgi:hypothetical protein
MLSLTKSRRFKWLEKKIRIKITFGFTKDDTKEKSIDDLKKGELKKTR